MRQALVSGRRRSAIDHFPFGAGCRGGRLRGLLGGRHVAIGGGQTRLQALNLGGLRRARTAEGRNVRFDLAHARGGAGSRHDGLANIGPVGRIRRRVVLRHRFQCLIQLAVGAQYALIQGVGLVFVVGQRAGQRGHGIDLLLQLGPGRIDFLINCRKLLLQFITSRQYRRFDRLDRVIDLGNLLTQLITRLVHTLVHRPGAILVDQINTAEQFLPQFAFGDLILDLLEDRASICAGHSGNHCRGYREEWAKVIGTIDQASPEVELLARAQALHHVLVLRVGQVCQLGGLVQVSTFAVPQLGTLGVAGASREAPLDADAEQQAFRIQEGNSRRQAFLAIQLSEGRAFPDRRNVERAHSAYACKVGTRVNADHVHRCCAGALQANPVAVVLAPLHVIGDSALHRRPGDGHRADRNTLVDHVGGRQGHACGGLHSGHRDNADRALVQLGAGVDRSELARVELERGDLVLALLGARCLQHPEQLHRQVVVIDCPLQFRLRLHAIRGGYRHRAAGHRLHRACLGGTVRQVQDQPVASLDRRVTVQGHNAAGSRRNPTAVWTAGNQFVCDGNDVTRQRNAPFHAGLESDGAVLAVTQQRPLAASLCLGCTGAADG